MLIIMRKHVQTVLLAFLYVYLDSAYHTLVDSHSNSQQSIKYIHPSKHFFPLWSVIVLKIKSTAALHVNKCYVNKTFLTLAKCNQIISELLEEAFRIRDLNGKLPNHLDMKYIYGWRPFWIQTSD